MRIIGRTVLIVTLFVALLTAASWLVDRHASDRIADGVRIDGVAVGGLTATEARDRIVADLLPRYRAPVVVRAGTQVMQITPADAGVHLDVAAAVDRALVSDDRSSVWARAWRNARGARVHALVWLRPTYSRRAVRAFVGHVRDTTEWAPRDASLTPGPGGLRVSPACAGTRMDARGITARIARALTEPRASHEVTASRRTVPRTSAPP